MIFKHCVTYVVVVEGPGVVVVEGPGVVDEEDVVEVVVVEPVEPLQLF